jgi:hypothetical protein
MICPHCKKDISSQDIARELGKAGGVKSRRTLTREQAQSMAQARGKSLSVVHQDNRYKLVGPIKEQELHDLSVKGFNSYQEALDAVELFGYKIYHTVKAY